MRYKFLDKDGKPLLVGKCQDDAIAVVNDIQTGLYWEAKSFDQTTVVIISGC